MNRYQIELDALSFSKDFEQKTIKNLTQLKAGQKVIKLRSQQKTWRKAVAVAVAAVFVFTIGAYGASSLMTAYEIAQMTGNAELAKAFRSGGAKVINERKILGDYEVTLMGTVSGKELGKLSKDVSNNQSYVLVSVARRDGKPCSVSLYDSETGQRDQMSGKDSQEVLFTVSPLVSGLQPYQNNVGGGTGIVLTGIDWNAQYLILGCDGLEAYQDRKIQLAVYDSDLGYPDEKLFVMDANGEHRYAEGIQKLHTMFTLDF